MQTATAPATHRFTVEEYHRMGEAGILTEDDRVELWEGELIEISPIGEHHAFWVTELYRLFLQQIGEGAVVRSQQPLALTENSEPQPDIVVARYREDRYRFGHPTPADVLLVVEVADTTLVYDRDIKVPGYGRAGVPEAWLWDLASERAYVHTEPSPEGYRNVRTYARGEAVAPGAFSEVRIGVDDAI